MQKSTSFRIPLQDEGIRAGVTVESLGKLKACDMQIGLDLSV